MNADLKSRLDAVGAKWRSGAAPVVALVVLPSPDYDVPSFNLGTAELAGYLRHRRPAMRDSIHFIEPDLLLSRTGRLGDSLSYCLDALRKLKPDVIGLSAKIGAQENLSALLTALQSESWADESVLICGNVLSTFSHDVLSERHPDVLYGVSDGELALDGLCGLLLGETQSLEEVPNIAFRRNGTLHLTPRRVLDHPSQHWLPALDMLDTAIAHKADIIFRATTGCPAFCTFCSIKAINLETRDSGRPRDVGWQSYPPQRTARLFALAQERGADYINLADDEFGNTDFDFIEAFADLLIAQGNRIRFNVSMRLDAFWTPAMPAELVARRRAVLGKLKRAGLSQMFVGAESGSVSQLRRYGKGYPLEVNTRAVEILLREQIQPCLGFITFDALISRKELEDNLAFLERTICGVPVYEMVASPLNVMHVQRATPYERHVRNKGLIGELEANLTFYRFRFENPELGRVAELAQDWFREILALRYPIIQLYRMSQGRSLFGRDSHDRSRECVAAMHKLDIALVRALLAAPDEDAVSEALRDFRLRRLPIEAGMRAVLAAAYSDKGRVEPKPECLVPMTIAAPAPFLNAAQLPAY